MRVRKKLAFLLACLTLLLALPPPSAQAEDLDIVIVETEDESDGEFIAVEGEENEDYLSGNWETGFSAAAGSSRIADIDWDMIRQVGCQHGGQACACFALAYCRTILDGQVYAYSDFSLGTSEEDAYASWTLGGYEGFCPEDRESAYAFMYAELCRGKPVVVKVEGPSTMHHYVAVVGYVGMTEDRAPTAFNFLIIDPGTGNFFLQNMGDWGYELRREDGRYQVEYDTESFVSLEQSWREIEVRSQGQYTLKAEAAGRLLFIPSSDLTAQQLLTLAMDERFITTALVEYWASGAGGAVIDGTARSYGITGAPRRGLSIHSLGELR